MVDDKATEKIFQRIDDIADLLSRIDERTTANSKSIGKFDSCIGDVKKSINKLQIEIATFDVRLTLKTGFIAVICGMVPPAVTMLLLYLTGKIG